ncbi:MAG: hypothetical protein AB1486_16180 [Planctomycetota bacterium]
MENRPIHLTSLVALDPRRTARLFPLLALIASAGACASSEIRERQALPFHVALIPVTATLTQPDAVNEEALEIKLEIDPKLTTRAMQEALDGKHFVKTSALPPPDNEQSSRWTDDEWGQYWVERATALNADLILQAELEYRPQLHTELNDKFYLNLPLFFLGGPFCWFISDRSYFYEARLRLTIYDRAFIEHRKWKSLERAAEILPPFPAQTAQVVDLDFLDRGSHVGHYLGTVIWPAGAWARDNDTVKHSLQEEVLRQLVSVMTEEIDRRRAEINEADLVADAYLDLDTTRVSVSGNRIRIEGDCIQKRRGLGLLDAYSVELPDGKRIPFTFEAPAEQRGRDRYVYRIAANVETTTPIETLRLLLDDQGRIRPYTLAVRSARGESRREG